MNLKKNHYSRRALALLLTLVMCVGMIPTAFAAQQNSYHDPAEHWMQASSRTNELDANSVVTRETFKCGECGKATSFEVFRVPEYTRNGQPALSRNVKYSDGTVLGWADMKESADNGGTWTSKSNSGFDCSAVITISGDAKNRCDFKEILAFAPVSGAAISAEDILQHNCAFPAASQVSKGGKEETPAAL